LEKLPIDSNCSEAVISVEPVIPVCGTTASPSSNSSSSLLNHISSSSSICRGSLLNRPVDTVTLQLRK